MTDMGDFWITTYTGKKFYPLSPRPEDVNIRDIAHALSNICRFTGHCPKFYSVAQHSVLVSQALSEENKLMGLLHDASEAYISDISQPVKHHGDFTAYRVIENRLMAAILEAFGLDDEPNQYNEVRDIDNLILRNEAKEFGMLKSDWWHYSLPDLGLKIVPLPPEKAEALYLKEFIEVSPRSQALAESFQKHGLPWGCHQ